MRFCLANFLMISLIACACGGCSGTQHVTDVVTGRTAVVAAVKMEDQYFPDERRQGINMLADRDYGRNPPYTDRYAQIAQSDPDYLVRATAIRALNRGTGGP